MESYGFFNGDTEYGQDEFNRYFNNLYENGVSIDESGAMTLSAVLSGNSIKLSPGFAIINGFYYYNDTDKSLPIIRNANYTRIDRLVLQLDYANKKITAILKAGTPSSGPTSPALTRNNLFYELSLYSLRIPSSGTITMTDERFNISLCGAIRPKNLTEYRDMVAEFDKEFKEWFNHVQGTGWRNIYIQADKPTDTVAGTIWIKG